MLKELSIRNLAVIESVQLRFSHGFHVLTGETGAGKSIIIDALGLIAGARGSADLVRFGCEKAEIEASFECAKAHPVWEELARLGIPASPDELLIIRREVTAQGKSSARVNGQMVNLAMLREIGERMVNIHGQHEHQSLLKTERHIELLDNYGGPDLSAAKEKYRSLYRAYAETAKELAHLRTAAMQGLQMADLYRFQCEEIAAAGLKIGEDELLAEEKRKLANAEKLAAAIAGAYDTLNGNGRALEAAAQAMAQVEAAAEFDKGALMPLLEQLQNAYYQLEDAAFQLRDYRENLEFNPERLEQIEERLNTIYGLKRKYGGSIAAILEHYDKTAKELDMIENKDERIRQLEERSARELADLANAAERLSALRKNAAANLSKDIIAQLRDLQMEKAGFAVHITRIEEPGGVNVNGTAVKFSQDGWDSVEFLISANPGEPLKSLSKIASGGELSRIMLALKTIFAGMESIPVLVFDEVDTGVSGRAAQAIAEKLADLAKGFQVFCITHLPQVACAADQHFLILKEVSGDRTYTRVEPLSEQGRVQELARMLGGVEITETTLHHASEMLRMAKEKIGNR
ncbi:MAG TPA: DNA repair protein RecN [Bacilli bacterium]